MLSFKDLLYACRYPLTFIFFISVLASAQNDQRISISYEKHILDNGLTVILSEDHRNPLVTVSVFYDVGSKDEAMGKTGFAHLFEHLMYGGSEHYPKDFFGALNLIGASEENGTTRKDFTNYFQTVPKTSLESILWLESDRMRNLLPAITEEKLKIQKAVVKNEKREQDSKPFSSFYSLLSENLYPAHHPYSWLPIGSMQDIDNASLSDVKDWFKKYYGAANTTLVIVGDIQPDESLSMVKKYFSSVASGPGLIKAKANFSPLSSHKKDTIQADVPYPKLSRSWVVPNDGHPDFNALDLASSVLTIGKSAALQKILVRDMRIARSAGAYLIPGQLASEFVLTVNLFRAEDLDRAEKTLDEILADFFEKTLSNKTLNRIRNQYTAGLIKRAQYNNGENGKAFSLGYNQLYFSDPDFDASRHQSILKMKERDVRETAKEWLDQAYYQITYLPFKERKQSEETVQRDHLPLPVSLPENKLPPYTSFRLKNGLQVFYHQNAFFPVFNLAMISKGGISSDSLGIAGTMNLMINTQKEGSNRWNGEKVSDFFIENGGSYQISSGRSLNYYFCEGLENNISKVISVCKDIFVNPAFKKKDFQRVKETALSSYQAEVGEISSLTSRIFNNVIFPNEHAYRRSQSGLGNEQTINQVELSDLQNLFERFITPENSAIIFAGSTPEEEAKQLLEATFGKWQGAKKNKAPTSINIETKPQEKSRIFILDRPQAVQTNLIAGTLLPHAEEGQTIAWEVINNVLGGDFSSRLNMMLREKKGWSYGAYSQIENSLFQQPLKIKTKIQSDKSPEAIKTLYSELDKLYQSHPINTDELEKARRKLNLLHIAKWQTNSAMLFELINIYNHGLDRSFFDHYQERLDQITTNDLQRLVKEHLNPAHFTWVAVGPLKKEQIERLNLFDEVIVLSEAEVAKLH